MSGSLARNTGRGFENAWVSNQAGANPDIYAQSSTQEYEIGTGFEDRDGSIYRYCLNGAVALVAGKLLQSPLPTANHTNIATGTAADASQNVVTISTTLSTAIVANEYDNGTIGFNDATGEGSCYRIVSHTAGTTGTVTLYYDLWEALATTTEFTLTRNPYRGTLVMPIVPTATCIGVAPRDVTAAYYFWAKTRGPYNVLTQGTIVIGQPVQTSGTTAGACQAATADTDIMVGHTMSVNADTEYSTVMLTIE